MDFTASYGVRKLPSSLENLIEPRMLSASDQVYSNIASVSPLDLNCMIYKYYEDLHLMAEMMLNFTEGRDRETFSKEQKHWERKANQLRNLIFNVHFDEESGRFLNYDMERKKKMNEGEHLTLHTYPLFTRLVDESQVQNIKTTIVNLTTKFGISFTKEKTGFQWDFNMWPLQTWLTAVGLMNYGFNKEAKEIGRGYINCVEKVFSEKGSFFEKYNPVEGSINTYGRYPSEPEFSWSAAIYIAFQAESIY
jgi:alpha,alpha-trehalase